MNTNASAPASGNSISNRRSEIGDLCRISCTSAGCRTSRRRRVDVAPGGVARRLSVDRHAERDQRSHSDRAHHEMQIAGVEAERDATVRRVQGRALATHRSVPRQRPLVEPERLGNRIDVRLVGHDDARIGSRGAAVLASAGGRSNMACPRSPPRCGGRFHLSPTIRARRALPPHGLRANDERSANAPSHGGTHSALTWRQSSARVAPWNYDRTSRTSTRSSTPSPR